MRRQALAQKAREQGFTVETGEEGKLTIKGKRKSVTIWPNGKATRNDIDYTLVKYMSIKEAADYLLN
jgi:hypothetical protein